MLMVFSGLPSEEGADPQSVLQEATDLLHTKFGFRSTTIQVELYSEDMSHCSHCQDPRDWTQTGLNRTPEGSDTLSQRSVRAGWTADNCATLRVLLPGGKLTCSKVIKPDNKLIRVSGVKRWCWDDFHSLSFMTGGVKMRNFWPESGAISQKNTRMSLMSFVLYQLLSSVSCFKQQIAQASAEPYFQFVGVYLLT